jgi:hypothetical protein
MMGHDPGGASGPDTDAGFEDPVVCRSNSLIKRGRSAEAEPFIRSLTRTVVKDPRFVTYNCPDVLHTWASCRPDLRVLLLERNLTLVARSFASKPDRFQRTDIDQMVADLTQFLDSLRAAVDRLNVPCHAVHLLRPDVAFREIEHALVDFGGLQLRPDARVVEEFGLRVRRLAPAEVWQAWFDPERIHFR